ncbi:high mobility group box domain-containing protein [Entophlyctis helioformis]|nr:high mobility group box domain-containing protein [Entophlyctis helioformis]
MVLSAHLRLLACAALPSAARPLAAAGATGAAAALAAAASAATPARSHAAALASLLLPGPAGLHGAFRGLAGASLAQAKGKELNIDLDVEIKAATSEAQRNAKAARALLKSLPHPSVEPPPKPMSAYLHFVKEQHPAVSKSLAHVDKATRSTAVMKELSKRWEAVSDKDRQPFQKRADADAAAYKDAYEQYLQRLTPTDRVILREINRANEKLGRSTVKVPKDAAAPKRPSSGYILLSAEYFKMNDADRRRLIGNAAAGTFQEQARALGAYWRSMSDAEKQPYIQKYIKAKESYDAALEKYNARVGSEVDAAKSAVKNLAKAAKAHVAPKRAKKAGVSSKSKQ